MKAVSVLKFIFIAIFTFFLFWGAVSIFAAEPPPEEPPPCVPGPVSSSYSVSSPFRCDDFTVYKCVNNACGKAGGSMEQGVEWYICQTTSFAWSDGCNSGGWSSTERISGPYGPENIGPYGKVQDYQICPAIYNNWGATPSVPACSGSCYPAPNLKPLDDAALLPKNVADGLKFKLPINFGWEDNVKKEVAKAPNFCTVGSYELNIVNPPLSKIVTNTQLQVIEDTTYKLGCQLKSNSAYQWRARACLDSGGTDCGEWPGSQNFNTSLVPELISPYDSDWNGIKSAENIEIPVKFDWCDVSQAQSYFMRINKNEKLYFPDLIEKEEGILSSEVSFGTEILTKYTIYDWEVATCLNASGTNCGLGCSNEQDGQECGDYSQYWKLATGDMVLPAPKIITPTSTEGIPVVNMSDYLSWQSLALKGVLSYRYEIKKGDATITDSTTTGSITSVSFKDLWNKLNFDQIYSWAVRSCWDEEGNECETEKSAASFKTTGAPPANIEIGPLDEKGKVIIPTFLRPDAMPGAASYYYEVSTATGTIAALQNPEGWVDYPNLKTKTNYFLQIKTCADNKGKVCGNPSSRNFTTFTFSSVSNPKPANGSDLFTYEKQLAWEPITGARYYQYKVDVLPENIVSTNSAFLPTEKLELGNHTWSVRACLDENCKETGEWSAFSFALIQAEKCDRALVPCGRDCNAPDTPYNEREPCQFKHLFLILKNIIDFFLWRLIPIVLVLLALATGAVFYFSMGAPGTIINVKGIWKSAGIGCLIIFSAWFIISWLLLFLGFQVQIFGHWWQSPF
jgi:hypothetical protein